MNDPGANKLPDLLLALRRKIKENAKESDLKYELTGSQLELLWFIGTTGSRTMESIATHLNIKPPSVTSLVDRMEKDGLVSREKDQNDRRIINIVLTEDTRKKFAKLREQKEAAFATMTSKLSPKDTKDLERILLLLIED